MSDDDVEQMLGSEPEPEFTTDVDQMKYHIHCALNHLTQVKAYTLQADELRDFKVAHYALRNISPDFGNQNLQETLDEKDYGDRR